MMMLAHGFGVSAEATAKLVYSNILWGYAVQSTPWIGTIPGYSIATLVATLLSASSILFALRLAKVPIPACLFATALCFVGPLLLWQFTITAGLLAVAGVLCIVAATARADTSIPVIVAIVLLFVGFLIRGGEALLVGIVAIPLLVRRDIWGRRDVQLGALALAALLACAWAVDKWAYSGNEWDYFRRFERVRVSITDFQAGARLRSSPELLQQHDLTIDEVRLIEGWGFVTRELTNPDRLAPALQQVGRFEHEAGLVTGIASALKTFSQPRLMLPCIAAIALFLVAPRLRLFLCWVLLIGAVGSLGALGRPGVERVYIPLIALVTLAPLQIAGGFLHPTWLSWKALAITAIPAVALALHMPRVVSDANRNADRYQYYRSAIDTLAGEDLVVWGARFPYEFAYSPFGPVPSIASRHFGLGALTYVPATHTEKEDRRGHGVLQRLRAPEGILVAAGAREFQLLRRYAAERFGEVLTTEPVVSVPGLIVSRWRLTSPADNRGS